MLKKILIMLCVFAIALPVFAGCADTSKAEYTVWTAPATIKVLKQYDEKNGLVYNAEKGNKLTITMAQNEYEGAQLIITAQSDISSYSVAVSDLTNTSGDKIAAKDISIFNQHYIETITKTATVSKQGWYPEALIPFDKAQAAGETKVKSGDNQGIWLKVRTTADTAAGNYKGNATLTVDSKTTTVPMEVTVWDFAITDQSHGRTAFLTYQDSIIQGEGDNSDEMLEAYYNFFLDNRITTAYLPAKADDNERFIEMLRKYYDHPAMTGYAVPYVVKGSGIDYDKFKAVLKLIVDASIEDKKDYMDKAYLYCTLFDEFDQTNVFGSGRKEMAKAISGRVDAIIGEIIKEYEQLDSSFFVDKEGEDFRPALKTSIVGFQNMAVARPTYDMKDYFNTWTIPATYFNNPTRRDEFKDMVFTEGNEVWWYTCVGPKAPEITYHIDDNLITSRVLSWMQKDYNLAGNLYWSTAAYVRRVDGDNERPVDPYTEPRRFGNDTVNGDGYLVYPGAKYGITGPVASVRTESIRDGQEDSEYLYLLESIYGELSTKYGATLNVNSALRTVYDSLYTGTIAYTDVTLMETARNQVAQMISNANGKENMVIENTTLTRAGLEVSVLIDSAYTITYNGEEPKSEIIGEGGKRYTITVPYSDGNMALNFSYSDGTTTKTYSSNLSTGRGILIQNDSQESLAKITMTENGVKELAKIDGLDVTKITATSKKTGDAVVDAAFKPGFTYDKDILNGKEKSIRDLSLRVYNPTNANIVMYLTCATEVLDVSYTITLKAGWNVVAFNNISVIKDTASLFFSFKNLDADGEPINNVVYISDLMYTMKKA